MKNRPDLETEYRLRALHQGYANAYAQVIETMARDLAHWTHMHDEAQKEAKKHEENIITLENQS